jgi:hypothetical protein
VSLLLARSSRWSEQYHQKQIALQGKFTFPVATPLDNPEGKKADEISLMRIEKVTFAYPSKGE